VLSAREDHASTVSVVITTYNHAHFLDDALTSVAAQTRQATEVIVVDDGSTDDPGSVVAGWPGVRLIWQDNRGLSAARNTGLQAAHSSYVLFLDADDLLTPSAIAAGLECFQRHPDAALVYGAHRRIDRDGRPLTKLRYQPISGDPFAALLQANLIGMHATVLYRRDALTETGGFDASLRRCEDYDAYLRLSRAYPVASHPEETALYRWHGTNMSTDPSHMLRSVLEVHRRHRPASSEGDQRRRAWQIGRTNLRNHYAGEVLEDAGMATGSRLRAALIAGRLAPALMTRLLLQTALRRVRALAIRRRRTP
jgi:glycosyltransferase involved in cell wall biosynthesis